MKIDKSVFRKPFIFLFTFFCTLSSFSQEKQQRAKIEGNFQLDSIWQPKVYLSAIESFDQMNTMSKAMIITSSPIDANGNFSFELHNIPENDHLYRLHLAKKSTSAASLIIGGHDENHFFLIVNSNSKINLKNNPNGPVFKQLKINGSPPNKQLRQIDEIAKYADSIDLRSSLEKSEFITRGVVDKLRQIADTSAHSLVSLYALYKSNFDPSSSIDQQFYKNYFEKWKHENSSYFNQFKSKFPNRKKNTILFYIFVGFTGLVLGYVLSKIFDKKTKHSLAVEKLSVQERKIFNLILLGQSNKEISEEYHIGLSTVKSHISNIYTKLKIKSRKEALNKFNNS